MARLGDICKFQSGGTPSKGEPSYFNGNIPWITTVALNGSIIDESCAVDWITEKAIENSAAKVVPANSVMVGTRVGVGKVAVNKVPMSTSQDIISLLDIDESRWSKEYICKFILGKATYLNSQARGATIKGIKIETLAGLQLPDIPLDQQYKIAVSIDAVNNLIALRKEQLAKLDQLVKSRFIELFGNLVIGDKVNTNKKKIGEIASVTKLAGFEFTKYIQYKEQGDIIMLRGLNCKKGHLVLDDIKWIDKETSDLLPRSKLYYGDILMTYAGTIGDVAMVDEDDKYHLAPNVAKITLNDKKACNPIFLMHLFMYTNDYIMTFASVVAQASINMEKIRNFEYYFPPVEQQNQFAAFVEQTDKSKLAIQQSLDKLELLKKSLMQEYFG